MAPLRPILGLWGLAGTLVFVGACARLEPAGLAGLVGPNKPPRKAPRSDDAPAKECDGIDAWGACEGNVVLRCEAEVLVASPCSGEFPVCAWVDDLSGFGCVSEDGTRAENDPRPSPAPEGGACGDVDYRGLCDGDVALFCNSGRLERIDCARWGRSCGLVDPESGYYCLSSEPSPEAQSPDAGVPEAPEAPPTAAPEAPAPPSGEPAPSPDEPAPSPDEPPEDAPAPPQERDEPPPDDIPAPPDDVPSPPDEAPEDVPGPPQDMAPSPPDDAPDAPPEGAPAPPEDLPAPPDVTPTGCGEVDYLGRCEGDDAVYCSGETELVRVKCADYQMGCGYIDENTGFYCTSEPDVAPPPPEAAPPSEPEVAPAPPAGPEPCGDVDYIGRCVGDIVEWCDNGVLVRRDCFAEDGQSCGYVNDDVGYYCGGDDAPEAEVP